MANKHIEPNGGTITNAGGNPAVNANLDHPGRERWHPNGYRIEYDTSDQVVDGSRSS